MKDVLAAAWVFVAVVQIAVVADSVWHAKPLRLWDAAFLAFYAVIGVATMYRWATKAKAR